MPLRDVRAVDGDIRTRFGGSCPPGSRSWRRSPARPSSSDARALVRRDGAQGSGDRPRGHDRPRRERSCSTTYPTSPRSTRRITRAPRSSFAARRAEEVYAALSLGPVACALVTDEALSRPRPRGDGLRLVRSSRPTRSAPATSRRGSGASRCSRSSSPSARSCRGPSRSPAPSRRRRFANPRYGPDGLALLRDGLAADEVVPRLTRRTTAAPERQLGVVDGQGRARVVHGRGVQRVGGASDGRRLRGAGEHPRLGRDGGCARRDVRGDRGKAARRTASRLPRRGAGSRRRQPRAAVGRHPRRRRRRRATRGLSDSLRRSPRRRPPSRRSRSSAASSAIHQELFGQTPRSQWIAVDDGLRKEIADRLAVLGYERLEDWAGVENLEERVDGLDAIDPFVLERSARALELAAAVAGEPAARARARGTPARDRDRAERRRARAPCSGPASAETRSSSPTGERERLVRLLAAERDELLRRGTAGQDVAVRDGAHRDVRDDRRTVARRDRDRERIRAGERRAAARDAGADGATSP